MKLKQLLQISPFLWRRIHLDFFIFPPYLVTFTSPTFTPVVPFLMAITWLQKQSQWFPLLGWLYVSVSLQQASLGLWDQFHLVVSFSSLFTLRSVSFWTINVVLTLYYLRGKFGLWIQPALSTLVVNCCIFTSIILHSHFCLSESHFLHRVTVLPPSGSLCSLTLFVYVCGYGLKFPHPMASPSWAGALFYRHCALLTQQHLVAWTACSV